MQDRSLLGSALWVLASLEYKKVADPADIGLLRHSALLEETDLDLDDLARSQDIAM